VGGVKGWKELGLRNVGYRASDQMLYLPTVGLLERSKAPDIKRLEQMRRMSRHTKRNDVVLFAIFFKFNRVVTFVPIED
jgi:hypothetical protein